MLAIIVDSGQQNPYAKSEVICCMLTTTIEQWGNSCRVQKYCASNEAQLTLLYVRANSEHIHARTCFAQELFFERVGWGY